MLRHCPVLDLTPSSIYALISSLAASCAAASRTALPLEIIAPRVMIEMIKRLMGCGFVYNLQDRLHGCESYHFEPLGGGDYGLAFLLGTSWFKPRLRVNKKDKRIERNNDGKWHGIGNTIRVDRRCDERRITKATRRFMLADGDGSVLSNEELRLAQIGMRRRLRRGLARMREQMLRTRMRQATAVPVNLSERDCLELRGEIEFEDNPPPQSAASSLPLLRVGDILLERLLSMAGTDDHDDDDASEPRGPAGRKWGLMRVCQSVTRRPVTKASQLYAVNGVWDETRRACTFTETRARRRVVEFGCFLACPQHLSGLFIVTPDAYFYDANCEVCLA